ncbi:MCE family protein [Mycobacterium sp. 1465703.0]|uniref:MCE family protein n=1 Tax=Mycobacterium sp. 1465703.0 TaxID=1834078 RepID=UPI000801A7AA|nr:MCE family protein [Mycobacterium sp. 1465703.0]OBJ08850.1 mammalian cell entry protein [Mycobacterium sp. 1465703.0]
MRSTIRRCAVAVVVVPLVLCALAGCQWQGVNSLPLPGTAGGGPGSYVIQAEMPDIGTMQRNSRVRVGDVTVGTVTNIQRQGWHALVTMRVSGDTPLPANTTATIGQTSLLGSLHVELAAPADEPAQGRLRNGAVIPLSSARSYPTTEQILAAVSMLLNGGGLGQLQEIIRTLGTAFNGRANEVGHIMGQLDDCLSALTNQISDITAATESLNRLAGKFSANQPVLDKALHTMPGAIAALRDQRHNLADALDELGKFSALATDTILKTRKSLVSEINSLGPVLKSLADAGPALTHSLSFFSTIPFTKEELTNWMRGDFGNITGIIDLTLSRLDAGLFTGTRWEGNLTELELQWGRTLGQLPSPYTARNPLLNPYQYDQGP